jgi:WD40 repeat protein
LVVWDASRRVPIHSLKADMQGAHSVAFSPEGRRLATGGTGRQGVKLWDLWTYRELGTLPMQGQRFAASITFSPDGHWVASGNFEGQLHLWRAPSWEEIAAAEAAGQEVSPAP